MSVRLRTTALGQILSLYQTTGWGGSGMQIPELELFSLDQSLQIGGPPTGWIQPEDLFCLAHMGFKTFFFNYLPMFIKGNILHKNLDSWLLFRK